MIILNRNCSDVDSASSPSLYIKDVLLAKRSGKKGIYKNLYFSQVTLCGTVTDCEKMSNKTKEILTIEDSTGSIKCMLPTNRSTIKANIQHQRHLMELKPKSSEFDNPALLVAHSTSMLLSRVLCQDLKPGAIIKVIGKLRVYENTIVYTFF